MESLNLFKPLKIEPPVPESVPEPKVEPDEELLSDLHDWKPTAKTVQSEMEFLSAYIEAHGFERDRRRLAALKHYLAG